MDSSPESHQPNPDLLPTAQTMDPPSPILPPPPGSISPPRFLSEDFEIRDQDDEDDEGNSHLNPAEHLMEPPLVEESAGEEDDDEDDDQKRVIVPNKAATQFQGLDTLTSDMAAKLQSMISEENEEPLPKDPPEVLEWSSNPITSPPPPVWRHEPDVAVVGGSVDEEDEEESSGNSQSPQQVHKILSPPPPPPEEEMDIAALPEKR